MGVSCGPPLLPDYWAGDHICPLILLFPRHFILLTSVSLTHLDVPLRFKLSNSTIVRVKIRRVEWFVQTLVYAILVPRGHVNLSIDYFWYTRDVIVALPEVDSVFYRRYPGMIIPQVNTAHFAPFVYVGPNMARSVNPLIRFLRIRVWWQPYAAIARDIRYSRPLEDCR